MKKVLFLVLSGMMAQALPGAIIPAQASHCSDSSQHEKSLPANYHCHSKSQGTENLDCHDHSGGLQAHQHGSGSQGESKSQSPKTGK